MKKEGSAQDLQAVPYIFSIAVVEGSAQELRESLPDVLRTTPFSFIQKAHSYTS